MSLIKKWHFPDLIYALHVVTMIKEFSSQMSSPQKVAFPGPSMFSTGLSYKNRSLLNKWYFLDQVCSVHAVTIKMGKLL